MDNTDVKVTIDKCFVCHNTIKLFTTVKGSKTGRCPVCKTVISKQQRKPKKETIKLVKI